jgi:hypothetical protein
MFNTPAAASPKPEMTEEQKKAAEARTAMRKANRGKPTF